MDLNSIVALAQAGFTKEQIYQLANAPQPQQPMQMQQPQMMQQPMQQPMQMQQPMMQPQMYPQMMQQPQQLPDGSGMMAAPLQAQTQQPQQNTEDPFMKLFEQMTGIKKAIQDNNIASSSIQGSAPETTDDILASIIQPTKPKEDK